MSAQLPQPIGDDWKIWGKRLVDSLLVAQSQLKYYLSGDSASLEGIMLWDRSGYPVISKDNAYRQVLIQGGCGHFVATATQTPSQADTAYAVAFNSATSADGLAINGSDATKIDVTETGVIAVDSLASR